MPAHTESEGDVLCFFSFNKTTMKKNVQKTLNIPYKRPIQFHSADKKTLNDPKDRQAATR